MKVIQVPFECYEDTLLHQKVAKTVYFGVNASSRSMFHVQKSLTRKIKTEEKVCSLCLSKINIEKGRQRSKECLEIQVTKTKSILWPYSKASEALQFVFQFLKLIDEEETHEVRFSCSYGKSWGRIFSIRKKR
ncbi:hypothetical protein TNCV_4200051 [Trichonephila clavipes]|uniref:Uncharacterized protein n=1 Tax=Trichonephila clavipes TaxID=2585209 RepID=A0A8X6WC45_TRICX|nr:hypothetical protein TNCV_4200051 [Trichonephila clavipes]